MGKDPLPADFVAFIQRLANGSKPLDPRRIFRACVLRWCLWRDGNRGNEIPGYAHCPDEDPRTGFPAGWSQRKFSDLCRETIGTAAIASARRAAALHH